MVVATGKEPTMTHQYVLTSSRRSTTVTFATVEAAEDFLTACKLSEETVVLTDLFDDSVVFTRTYN